MNTTKTLSGAMLLSAALLLSSCGREDAPAPEIIPSDGTKLTLQGGEGAADAINAVYVDLSTNEQSSVRRDSWSLGFAMGSSFRVILNNQYGYSALETNQTDINAVKESNVDITALATGFDPSKLSLFDDPDGDLTKTVIAEVSATATENKVYLVLEEFAQEAAVDKVWKVRLSRDQNAYTLQYAKLNDNNYQTATITKEEAHNFKFFSFANGEVTVEPQKAAWDFVWTKSVYKTAMGLNVFIPYTFGDFVQINHLYQTSASEVLIDETQTKTYEEFGEADLSTINFSNTKNIIGGNWRATTGANAGVATDRFYLIKDSAGNIYKLKFLSMGATSTQNSTGDGGRRGYPELEYKLLKRG